MDLHRERAPEVQCDGIMSLTFLLSFCSLKNNMIYNVRRKRAATIQVPEGLETVQSTRSRGEYAIRNPHLGPPVDNLTGQNT